MMTLKEENFSKSKKNRKNFPDTQSSIHQWSRKIFESVIYQTIYFFWYNFFNQSSIYVYLNHLYILN